MDCPESADWTERVGTDRRGTRNETLRSHQRMPTGVSRDKGRERMNKFKGMARGLLCLKERSWKSKFTRAGASAESLCHATAPATGGTGPRAAKTDAGHATWTAQPTPPNAGPPNTSPPPLASHPTHPTAIDNAAPTQSPHQPALHPPALLHPPAGRNPPIARHAFFCARKASIPSCVSGLRRCLLRRSCGALRLHHNLGAHPIPGCPSPTPLRGGFLNPTR